MLEVFVEPSGYHNKTACPTMGVGSFFSRGGANTGFFQEATKSNFPGDRQW